MQENVNRKYVLALAGASLLILGGGALLRPSKHGKAAVPVPSEAGPLPALSQEDELAQTPEFFADRAAEIAPQLSFVPAYSATGIRWSREEWIVPSQQANAANPDELNPPVVAIPADDPGHGARPIKRPKARKNAANASWALLIALRPDSQPIWSAGFAAAQTALQCGAFSVHELQFSAPVHSAFAGGGLFGLDGILLGVVIRCGERFPIVAAGDVELLLQSSADPEHRLFRNLGARVSPLAAVNAKAFGAPPGVLVNEIARDGPAARPGSLPEMWSRRLTASLYPVWPISSCSPAERTNITQWSWCGRESRSM